MHTDTQTPKRSVKELIIKGSSSGGTQVSRVRTTKCKIRKSILAPAWLQQSSNISAFWNRICSAPQIACPFASICTILQSQPLCPTAGKQKELFAVVVSKTTHVYPAERPTLGCPQKGTNFFQRRTALNQKCWTPSAVIYT